MILKLSIVGLFVVLIVVLTISYYMQLEGFDNISAPAAAPITKNGIVPVAGTAVPLAEEPPVAPASKSDLSKGLSNASSSGAGFVPASQTNVATGSASNPQRNDIQPQVAMSDTSYDAMSLKQKSDLLSNIQKIFRNELLANRSTDSSVMDTSSSSCSDSSSTQQGNEFNKKSQKGDSPSDEDSYRCPKNPDGSCPPVPDMTQYIKKDAIPCWGCSVDY